ncbi:uncharacterized protein BX664DRAFT_315998 [Halteromyces radiatus]|uniref:uncharacterized protein n=1 Tax=Halteromyces radiatus TaxID=101107 RepID=UPI002220F992|nr:uncharacterized protein BX664DRAFT_315998 [Halteromyces radiatus]KAI8084443.1 hypothetical protein BX664DRAFT_315998 [Halteromyces radiatus]
MPTITRGQAICMFYGEKYTKENVAILTKRIEDAQVDICYTDDPNNAFLIWEKKVNQQPLRYHTYADEIQKPGSNDDTSVITGFPLTCSAQIVQFLNMVYLADNPGNEELYDYQQETQKRILSNVWKYTTIFDEKGIRMFGRLAFWRPPKTTT